VHDASQLLREYSGDIFVCWTAIQYCWCHHKCETQQSVCSNSGITAAVQRDVITIICRL